MDFLHPDYRKTVEDRLRKAREEGREAPLIEEKFIRLDGTDVDVEVVATPITYQGKPAVQAIVRDITERKQAEEELRKHRQHLEELVDERSHELHRSEERLSSFMQSATDGFYLYDSEFNLVEANTVALKMLRLDRLEAIGKHALELSPRLIETGRYDLYKRVLETGGALFLEDVISLPEFGKMHLNVKAFKTGDGLGIIVEDVTERKQAQEKLEKLYKKEKKLRQQLEEEMRKRVEFTRALAHELKTPLTPVVMSSQTLVSQLQEGPLLALEPLLRLATNISRGASNLNSRIDELLDLARGEMGMLKLRTEPVDALALLREVIEDVASVASNKGQSLVSRLPHSLPSISADRTRLKQIVLNLLNNAFKFTPHGGRITLRAKEDDGNLTIEVKDTGPGISKEEQERLFEPYHRVEHDRERLSGLGLGLALCKTLVELHGGRIWAKSGVGKGSTFGFSLPLQSSADEQETLRIAIS